MITDKQQIRDLLAQNLIDVDEDTLINSWFQIIATDPEFAAIQDLPDGELELTDDIIAAITNPFFLDGLKNLIIRNVVYEFFLLRLRHALLLQKPDIEDFAEAMAEQCYKNGYVFYVTDDELEALEELGDSSLDQKILSCYQNTKEQETYRGESLSDITDKTSQKVQEQYEESPYPVWQYIDKASISSKNSDVKSILIAGCGTGLQVVMMALAYPQAQVTAMDISRSSLSYAQRKAEEFGVSERVRFLHGDLLEAGKIEGAFDAIVSTGVLHHLKKPQDGMDVLLNKLKPGGVLKLALYSELGRYDVNAGIKLVKEKNYKATPEDIREFRRHIVAADGIYQDILNRRDFYTLQECRDLFFHVQEHQLSIPDIQKLIKGGKFLRFLLPPDILAQYEKEFPEQPQTLENWHIFEHKYPRTFKGMYTFLVEKEG